MTQPSDALPPGARICRHQLRPVPHAPQWLTCDTCQADFPQLRHTADHITDDDLDALYARLANAELKAEAMTAAMQSTATDALKHRGCHMKLMAQCTRAERAEAALNAIRAVHRPARDWSWKAFGCDHDGAHHQLCGHCRTCYPCPTIAALDTHTTPTET